MHRTAKGGLGAAYLAGFAWGLNREYSVLVEMDADGSHPPEQLHRLLDAVDGGADLVIGSRYVPGGEVRNWPRRRMVLSRTANGYSRILLGVDIHDITAGYRAYRREVLEKIDLAAVDSKGYCFQIDLTWRTINNGFDRRRGADHLHRTRVRSIQDERIQHPRSPVQGRGMGHPRALGPRPRRCTR